MFYGSSRQPFSSGRALFCFEVTTLTVQGPIAVIVRLSPGRRTQISTRSLRSTLMRSVFTPRPQTGCFYQRNVLGANLGDGFQHGLK